MGSHDPHRQFTRADMDEHDLLNDPLAQFQDWFAAAEAAGVEGPDAMTLATVAAGQPTARIVFLRGLDERGFVFFTNYLSRKGRDLEKNPLAALNFYWPAMERQVRVEGQVSKVSDEESDAYFEGRPRGSQLGAWVSTQSDVIPGRAFLDQRLAEFEQRFAGHAVPRPDHWGGYRLSPTMIEFWQGRANRLHDRIRYRLEQGKWLRERLAP